MKDNLKITQQKVLSERKEKFKIIDNIKEILERVEFNINLMPFHFDTTSLKDFQKLESKIKEVLK